MKVHTGPEIGKETVTIIKSQKRRKNLNYNAQDQSLTKICNRKFFKLFTGRKEPKPYAVVNPFDDFYRGRFKIL